MELKQMEYLVAAVESKSLNKAAELLYTTQPNVSKVLKNLEEELEVAVLIRSSKGIMLTSFGEQLYINAKNMIQNAQIIKELAKETSCHQLKIASYPSNMIARKLAEYYMSKHDEQIHIEFQTGTAEDVINLVAEGQAKLGIVYLAKKQEQIFQKILINKNLRFTNLRECELCLYVGPLHPYYDCEFIDFEEMKNQKFVQGEKDYFSMVDHLEHFSLGAIRTEQLNHVVHTNSDHVMIDMLLYTDLCSLGLDFMHSNYSQYDIRAIKINNCEKCLLVGYVTGGMQQLQPHEEEFIRELTKLYK